MTEMELLSKVKTGLMITGNNFDDVLKLHIANVKDFMKSSGVDESVVNDSISVGCILIGVNDLWNNAGGTFKFSEYFRWRVAQLSGCSCKPVPIMTYTACVPTEETVGVFGWFYTTLLKFVKNVNKCEFDVDDNRIVKVTVQTSDGSVISGENSGTGNRRNISVEGYTIGVYPNTVYDLTQSKFVTSEGNTSLVIPKDLSESTIIFETFEKAVE